MPWAALYRPLWAIPRSSPPWKDPFPPEEPAHNGGPARWLARTRRERGPAPEKPPTGVSAGIQINRPHTHGRTGTPESAPAPAAAVGPLSGASRSLAPRWGPNHFFGGVLPVVLPATEGPEIPAQGRAPGCVLAFDALARGSRPVGPGGRVHGPRRAVISRSSARPHRPQLRRPMHICSPSRATATRRPVVRPWPTRRGAPARWRDHGVRSEPRSRRGP